MSNNLDADQQSADPIDFNNTTPTWMIGCLGIGSIGMILFAVTALFIVRARQESSPETFSGDKQWRNQFQQIGIALQNYHHVHKTFPPGETVDASGKAYHSWMRQILPMIGSGRPSLHGVTPAHLVHMINDQHPWDDPINQYVFQSAVQEYLYPGEPETHDRAGYALSHLAGNAQLFYENSQVKFSDMTDGKANTILAGDVSGDYRPWGAPRNARDPALVGINEDEDSFGRSEQYGAQFLMGDGSVRLVDETIDPDILKAISSPAGKEPLPADWK